MTVNSTTAAPAVTQDISILGQDQLATSYDTFMTLLSAQIKNQDPLAPMDGNQFTQQLVQMTGVQQQLYSNDLLNQLVTNSGTGMSEAVSVIGREITAASDKAIVSAGQAKWNYNLAKDAASVKIEVLDSQGKLVAVSTPTNVKAGDQTFTWDGKDLNGVKRADGGEYSLKITPLDGSGATVVSQVFQRGVVTAVEQVGGQPVLSTGGAKVPWSAVTSVRQPA